MDQGQFVYLPTFFLSDEFTEELRARQFGTSIQSNHHPKEQGQGSQAVLDDLRQQIYQQTGLFNEAVNTVKELRDASRRETQEVRLELSEFQQQVNTRFEQVERELKMSNDWNHQMWVQALKQSKEQSKINAKFSTALVKKLTKTTNAGDLPSSVVSAARVVLTHDMASILEALGDIINTPGCFSKKNCTHCGKLLASSYLPRHVGYHCPEKRRRNRSEQLELNPNAVEAMNGIEGGM